MLVLVAPSIVIYEYEIYHELLKNVLVYDIILPLFFFLIPRQYSLLQKELKISRFSL